MAGGHLVLPVAGMTTNLETPADGKAPSSGDALALRPFLDVCIGIAGPTLVEASRAAELVGLVELHEGTVWRCIHENHEGDSALRTLLEEQFDEVVIRRGGGPRGARNVFLAGVPAAGAPEAKFESLWDAGIAALLEKDFPRALEVFRSAARIRPDDANLRANLSRLRDMGFGGE